MRPGARRHSVAAVHALILTYELDGATPPEHSELYEQLAPALAAVPGLVSQARLANESIGRYGGFYVFDSRSSFDRFVASELFEALRSHRTVRDAATLDFDLDGDRPAPTRAGAAGGAG